jgi:hypothetical protein
MSEESIMKDGEIRINARIIEVKEITIGQILDSWEKLTKESSIFDIMKLAIPIVTNMSFEEVKALKPSEIAKIIEEVKRKNKGFLLIADSLGLGDVVREMLANVKRNIIGEILAAQTKQNLQVMNVQIVKPSE